VGRSPRTAYLLSSFHPTFGAHAGGRFFFRCCMTSEIFLLRTGFILQNSSGSFCIESVAPSFNGVLVFGETLPRISAPSVTLLPIHRKSYENPSASWPSMASLSRPLAANSWNSVVFRCAGLCRPQAQRAVAASAVLRKRRSWRRG
jgi:hypothetical protein